MNHQIEDYIINFLARKESPEDVHKLQEWLAADPLRRDELKQWLAVWDAATVMDMDEKISPEKAYQRFMFRIGAEEKETPAKVIRADIFRTILRIAAIFAISFSLGIFSHYYWERNQQGEFALIENIVPPGSKSEIKLPDGSTVLLNAGSTLRYPANFGKKRRDVYLEGEGYFTVAKQTARPFTVHTAWAKIKDLGTEFNVKSYPDENVMETILISGELSVENSDSFSAIERPILLKPGQKLTLTAEPDTQPVVVVTQLEPDMAEAEVSWKERDWRIERVPLQDLAVRLERRYDVRIHVDDQLKSHSFTGPIPDVSLEQVLNIIRLSAPILYHIDGKDVYISVDPENE